MAEAPLPEGYGVPLKMLQTGLLSGLEGALNPTVRSQFDQVIKMYRALDEARRERADALVRADGRVPAQAIRLLFQEQMAQPRPIISLRDTTRSDLA